VCADMHACMRAHTLFSCFGTSGIRIEGKVQEPDPVTFSL
jgi:hypothetical protein